MRVGVVGVVNLGVLVSVLRTTSSTFFEEKGAPPREILATPMAQETCLVANVLFLLNEKMWLSLNVLRVNV